MNRRSGLIYGSIAAATATTLMVCAYYFVLWLQAASFGKTLSDSAFPVVVSKALAAPVGAELHGIRPQGRACFYPIRLCAGIDIDADLVDRVQDVERVLNAIRYPCSALRNAAPLSGDVQVKRASDLLKCDDIARHEYVEIEVSVSKPAAGNKERELVQLYVITATFGGKQ